MLRLLLISLLIFINIPSFAENTEIITYLDKRESQALKIEDNLTQTEEVIEGRLNQTELGIFYFEADSSDKLEKKLESEEYYNKILTHYQPILDNPKSTKLEKLKALKEITKVEIRQDEFDEVFRLCQNFLWEYPETKPDIALIYYRLCNRYQQLKRYNEAIPVYEDVVRLAPESNLAINSQIAIGWCYFTQKDYDNAIIAYSKVASYPHVDSASIAQYWVGQSYLAKGDISQALKEYQKTIDRFPKSIGATHSEERIKTLTKLYPTPLPLETTR